jgi:adenylate kinase family enzyme
MFMDWQNQCNVHQNPNIILHRNRKKSTLKFIWKHKSLWIAKTILIKRAMRYYNAGLQVIQQSCSNNTLWYWHKNRHKDWWNRVEDLEIKLHSYTTTAISFWKKNQKYTLKKRQPLQEIMLVQLVIYIQKIKSRLLWTCTKINSKWIKDFNIRP